MSAVKAQAQSWLASGLKAIVIELSSVRGSVPREQGTRMLVSLDSALGTIGGGRLEFEAVERARLLAIRQFGSITAATNNCAWAFLGAVLRWFG